MSENRPTLLQRINAVQREVDYVQKEKKQGMRYSIVSHDAVTAKVRPLMVKHGVVYFPCEMDIQQSGNRTQATMTVRFVSIDDASDFMDVKSAGYGIDDQDKGPGKAISYAVKYALLKALGLESGDDPDQDQDVVHHISPESQQRQKREVGTNPKTGMRTAYSLKKEIGQHPDAWDAFLGEVKEAATVQGCTKLALAWSTIADRDRWPADWREIAKETINRRRDEILNGSPDEDTFPADRPGGVAYEDSYGR